jgi:hypothetical protein
MEEVSFNIEDGEEPKDVVVQERCKFVPIKLSRKKNRLGVTAIQDAFAKGCSVYSEDELGTGKALEVWLAIPGVVINSNKTILYNNVRAMLSKKNVKYAIERYREVRGKDKLGLLVEREDVTEEILRRWKEDKVPVKTADALNALRGREEMYGFVGKSDGEIESLLNNPRLKEGMEIIDVTPKSED